MADESSSKLPVAAHGSLERRPVASTSSSTPAESSANNDDDQEHGAGALAAAHLDAALPSELVYSLVLNWRGSKQQVSVVESDTVGLASASRWGAHVLVSLS